MATAKKTARKNLESPAEMAARHERERIAEWVIDNAEVVFQTDRYGLADMIRRSHIED